ncbi:hypothetical protein CAOG_08426 [Capsaspora owczarzaki ATCC 30864]|uniref:Uncharacterized protein n=1 Tax=Capsaspora owczarzaki (strain ATCC 30864) TaxID=595528 RepID=A0A0D2U192_CAPO3|nr:hypothetical protein CAOG_08426 [Capsaspora owczarzaki ATCC 30864]KJE88981.1 hypothetical protein CAOG_008426 [Capsaspora owczarzaki ATCC 30864]|eukprot:XP_011269997.1 hypothetical protein CAOG_08426 [Capsaspora owczarzaki ATCC 30864]
MLSQGLLLAHAAARSLPGCASLHRATVSVLRLQTASSQPGGRRQCRSHTTAILRSSSSVLTQQPVPQQASQITAGQDQREQMGAFVPLHPRAMLPRRPPSHLVCRVQEAKPTSATANRLPLNRKPEQPSRGLAAKSARKSTNILDDEEEEEEEQEAAVLAKELNDQHHADAAIAAAQPPLWAVADVENGRILFLRLMEGGRLHLEAALGTNRVTFDWDPIHRYAQRVVLPFHERPEQSWCFTPLEYTQPITSFDSTGIMSPSKIWSPAPQTLLVADSGAGRVLRVNTVDRTATTAVIASKLIRRLFALAPTMRGSLFEPADSTLDVPTLKHIKHYHSNLFGPLIHRPQSIHKTAAVEHLALCATGLAANTTTATTTVDQVLPVPAEELVADARDQIAANHCKTLQVDWVAPPALDSSDESSDLHNLYAALETGRIHQGLESLSVSFPSGQPPFTNPSVPVLKPLMPYAARSDLPVPVVWHSVLQLEPGEHIIPVQVSLTDTTLALPRPPSLSYSIAGSMTDLHLLRAMHLPPDTITAFERDEMEFFDSSDIPPPVLPATMPVNQPYLYVSAFPGTGRINLNLHVFLGPATVTGASDGVSAFQLVHVEIPVRVVKPAVPSSEPQAPPQIRVVLSNS